MSDSVSPQILCARCRAALDPSDNYCRRCGEATHATAPPSGWPSRAGASQPGWSESPALILPLLFFVLGPLALPLLWNSRRFTFLWKVVLTLVVTGLTLYMVWEIWAITDRVLGPLQRDLRKIQGL